MKIRLALFAVLTALVLSRCSDDESPYECTSCVDSPEALAANDASGKGIYKGLVIGSSGQIYLDIDNDGLGEIIMTLTIDGQTIELTTEATYNPDVGFQGVFYGTMNTANDVEISFWSSADGSEYGIVYAEIPGHDNVSIELVKELSTALVKVFEGTFSGNSEGTLNLILVDDEWYALARPTDGTSDGVTSCEGDIEGNTLVSDCTDIQISGTISGDNISGQWTSQGTTGTTEAGTWKAKRTL
jgi:hypothetical protein